VPTGSDTVGVPSRVAGRCLAAIHVNPKLISELRQGMELGGRHGAYSHPVIISLHDMNCIQLSKHWIPCRAPHAVNPACVARGQTVPVGNLHSVTDDNFKDKAQDHLNHSSFSHSSIYHGVVNGTVRPIGMEVFLDEGTTLVVNRLLLAIHGSMFSEAATQAVIARANPHDTEIRVLHVIEIPSPRVPEMMDYYPGIEHARDAQRGRAEALVSRAAELIRSKGCRVTTAVELDDPKSKILEAAEEWHVDLIVLGSRGGTRLHPLLMGSVSDAIARHATCSVEIVRTAKRREEAHARSICFYRTGPIPLRGLAFPSETFSMLSNYFWIVIYIWREISFTAFTAASNCSIFRCIASAIRSRLDYLTSRRALTIS
jgi:nucleotide-binding universal stress UspA family protein